MIIYGYRIDALFCRKSSVAIIGLQEGAVIYE